MDLVQYGNFTPYQPGCGGNPPYRPWISSRHHDLLSRIGNLDQDDNTKMTLLHMSKLSLPYITTEGLVSTTLRTHTLHHIEDYEYNWFIERLVLISGTDQGVVSEHTPFEMLIQNFVAKSHWFIMPVETLAHSEVCRLSKVGLIHSPPTSR